MVPADNNAAEQAIRCFCIGKRNWHLIDTVHGAQASAMIYSIAETAKEFKTLSILRIPFDRDIQTHG